VTTPIPDIVLADPVYVFAAQALACLQATYPVSGYGPERYEFRVGTSITYDMDQFLDLCCAGLGYVTLGETYPSASSFPEQDVVRQANTVCPPPAWSQRITLGIVRCIPTVIDDLGSMPSASDWTLAFYKNVADVIALRRTACCLRDWLVGQTGLLLGMSMVIENQTQGSPQGGCVERTLTMALQYPNCDCIQL
jgi:hypothetical protein